MYIFLLFFWEKRCLTTFPLESEMLWHTQAGGLKERRGSSEEDSCFPTGAVTPRESGARCGEAEFCVRSCPSAIGRGELPGRIWLVARP